jgi:hypothetical protein
VALSSMQLAIQLKLALDILGVIDIWVEFKTMKWGKTGVSSRVEHKPMLRCGAA